MYSSLGGASIAALCQNEYQRKPFMTDRIYNLSAGPAVLPVEVLEEARDNLLSLGTTGIGIMEHSHRGRAYMAVHEEAESLCRELAGIPNDYHVLFLQG